MVVDPTTGGQVDFLARSIIDNMTFDQKKVPQNNVDTLVKTFFVLNRRVLAAASSSLVAETQPLITGIQMERD